ncbi:hypothetical protein DENSPDRAFT_752236, partial [Dentipellis sp. KUC8613]
QNLRLNNYDGTLMAFINTSMPPGMRARLLSNVHACFKLHDCDTEKENNPNFDAFHFSWYNRSVTSGRNAPENVHPLFLRKEGASRTNYSQMTPYLSADAKKHAELLEEMKIIFEEVFQWIEQELQDKLPREYELLSMDAQFLPGNALSPVHPFLGFVVNLNVSTKGHRDSKDKTYCLVLPIGEFKDGALVFYEQGLTIELQSGDFIVFQS